MAGELSGKIFVLRGRFVSLSRREAVAGIERRAGTVRRGLSRGAHSLVIGGGAVRRLADGSLIRMLARADALGIETLSERGLLCLLGDAGGDDGDAGARVFTLADVAARSGLDDESVRLLALFDVIAPEDGRCGFRDIVVAKDAARLMADGADLATVIDSIGKLRAHSPESGSPPRLARAADGSLTLRIGGEALADLDGQIRLALPDAGNSSVDDLFHAAEDAEEGGDMGAAERLYRRCIDRDKRDPSAPFNLANVLREQGRVGEARLYLQLAVSIDPRFAEAWYNLGDLAESTGDEAAAIGCLERAVEIDPAYADALFNLASLAFRTEAYGKALGHWERYVALDRESEWGKKARDGILLCRHHLK